MELLSAKCHGHRIMIPFVFRLVPYEPRFHKPFSLPEGTKSPRKMKADCWSSQFVCFHVNQIKRVIWRDPLNWKQVWHVFTASHSLDNNALINLDASLESYRTCMLLPAVPSLPTCMFTCPWTGFLFIQMLCTDTHFSHLSHRGVSTCLDFVAVLRNKDKMWCQN